MNINNTIMYVCLASLFLFKNASADEITNKNITIYKVMQRILERYPSLKISAMEVVQAEEQRAQVKSSLGWILNSSAGITRDLSLLGTPSERLDVNGSISRQLESGATLSLNGAYRYEDSSLSFSSDLPNPAHTTSLDLSYRLPLLQGEGNPFYTESLVSAAEQLELAKANHLLIRMSLAENVKGLFYSAVLIQSKIENAKQSVQRTKKLAFFINKNVNLGLSEKKDKLQVKAQLDSKLAELSALQLQWQQLKNSLNRLMLEQWGKSFQPVLVNTKTIKQARLKELITLTKKYHPSLKISQAKLTISESQIKSARDNKKDTVDLVMSVGTRTSNGKSTAATVSEQDWAGGISVQYKHLFDEKGVSAKYKQALIEKSIAEQNILKTNNDIEYTVSDLVSEIKSARLAVVAAKRRQSSEALKLKEAEHRFRSGRADTAQLIQFQNEYSFSQLNYQSQKIDLNNRIITLQIYSGRFWDVLANQNTQGVKK